VANTNCLTVADDKPKIMNHVVDVAFSVEGPWERFEDIPKDALIDGLTRRLQALKNEHFDIDAFGDCGNPYEVD